MPWITSFNSFLLALIQTSDSPMPLLNNASQEVFNVTYVKEYNPTHEVEVACRLFKELSDQRIHKSMETVEKTNFTHSSRKTWNLLCKLVTAANSAVPF
jgi:hypothetical protein